MRRYFFQLFLSFWVATMGIVVAARFLFPDGRDIMGSSLSDSTRKLGMLPFQAYREHGCDGIAALSPQITLADAKGKPLRSVPLGDEIQQTLAAASRQGETSSRHIGADWVQVRVQEFNAGER